VVTATIKRWVGSHTFAERTGQTGLHLVDAQSARYGDFDDVQLVGLIAGEWPERVRRNVLYPSSLMSLLEPLPAAADPGRRDREALHSARAAFKDLIGSPALTLRLSTFALENDAVVEPSILLEDIALLPLAIERREASSIRASRSDGLALEPRCADGVAEAAEAWAAIRLGVDERAPETFRGEAGPWVLPHVSVSRLERYLDCPFRFFGSEVLRLEEEPDDEDTRTPLERGRFLHELWEQFFREWQARGRGRIEPDQLPEARELFEALCESALAKLSPAEAALERNRLLGSAVSPGIAHRVFAMEADRPTPILERLLEYPLQGDFTFASASGEPRRVRLSAKADRIDLLADGTLRIVDYKSKKIPDLKQALQLPIYSVCARESLRTQRVDRPWTVGEALYLSFEGDKAVVPLRAKGRNLDELLNDAEGRLVTAMDDIARGRFSASPAKRSLCAPCPYRAVCRLEIVERVEDSGS
jgi:RecB family exonuclease